MPALIGSIAVYRTRDTYPRRLLAQLAIMSVTVDDNTQVSRYEARVGGALAGISEYELADDNNTIVFLHTVVAQKYEGQGVGGAIAKYALDDARARGLQVLALCPFIKGWMGRHPEYSDLVSPAG
jgi:predicted GNAT family acetyltransferase